MLHLSVLCRLKFLDLDPAMISLLIQAKLSEEDLKNKDVPEVVDCIITQFGGLKAVQTELRRKSRISCLLYNKDL